MPVSVITVTAIKSGTPSVITINSGPAGPTGPAGPNSVTSATTSDGTASLSISDLQTATATVSGTLTANHIHGNIAGSVYSHVRAGENLSKGDPVYISGYHGSGANLIPIVSRAQSGNSSKMPAVGVMDSALSANANGHMVIVGTITDLNTNAYPVNSTLYVGDSGGLIDSGGISGFGNIANLQAVARVERQNTNNGAIIVKVNGVGSNGGYGPSDGNKNAIFNIDGSLTARSDGIALYATTTGGIGVYAYAEDEGTGLNATSEVGTYHAFFGGDGNDRSAIERVRGWFVWFYSTFVGRLKTANITANRDWTLPNATGELMLKEENLSGLANQGTSRTNLGAGTIGDALFIASNLANARTALGISMAYCTTQESRNTTTTLADDSVMTLALDANSTYEISARLSFTTATSTPGHKWAIVFSAALSGTNGNNGGEYSAAGVFSNYGIVSSTGVGDTIVRTGNSTGYVWKYRAIIQTANACNVKVQWAQNTSDAANVTRNADSYLRAQIIYP